MAGPPPLPGQEDLSHLQGQKRKRDDIKDLEIQKNSCEMQFIVAKDKIHASHSFDAAYWESAADASSKAAKWHELELRLAIAKFEEEAAHAPETVAFWRTPQAHAIVDQIRAATTEQRLYEKQIERASKGAPIHRAIVSIFNASKLGLGVEESGVGRRRRTRFKKNLARAYHAEIRGTNDKRVYAVYDTATGRNLQHRAWRAAHVVPHCLGPDLLIAFFGEDVAGELDTPRNGLVLDPVVEDAFDDGSLTIVPDLPNNPKPEDLKAWQAQEVKEYKWRVLDPLSASVHEILQTSTGEDDPLRTVVDLDGKKLHFKCDFRPRARYLYFAFLVSHLKQAWRAEYCTDPGAILKSQLGCAVWASDEDYLAPSFLMAMAQEIGHATELISDRTRNRTKVEPDEAALLGITKLLGERGRIRMEAVYEDEDEYGDDDEY